mgnify:CR=1 FL=1
MKIKILNNIVKILFLFFIILTVSHCDQSSEKIVDENEEINVKVFSSLTCPHCANFHKKVILSIKSDEKLNSVVRFEHIGFPLDLAALNGEKILYCSKNQENRFELLTHLYDEQNNWASQSNINDINESLKKIGKKFKMDDSKLEKCLKDEKLEELILEKFLKAQKEFKIKSTPTIFINNKKYEGKHNFKEFKKAIEKL